jgi:hypothetical protein
VRAVTDRALPKSDVYPLGDPPAKWQREALCAGQDPKVWVNNRTNAAAPRRLQRVCAKCPVAVPCLNEGLNECRVSVRTSDTVGTRAGTSAYVRNLLYKLWRADHKDHFRAELIKAKWSEDAADEMVAQLPPPPGKTCANCETRKPRGEFYKNKRSPDGVAWWCKTCVKASNRTRRGE